MNILKEDTLSHLPADLVTKARHMSKAYEYLYCVENVLRVFLDNHPSRPQFVIPASVQKNINDRKNDEAKHKWMALRGNSDLFYIDFKDIGGIIISNWPLLSNDFPSQSWITGKIDDLVRCRNLIAHNSYLEKHELEVIRAYYNSIIRQLNINTLSIPVSLPGNPPGTFVEGLNRSVLWTAQQVSEGAEYLLEYPAELDVAPLSLRTFYYQVDVVFQIRYANSLLFLDPSFQCGRIEEGDASGEYKSNVVFQAGQYDIDGDGLDELFICQRDDGNGEADNSIEIKVYKYYPPAYHQHVRADNWELIGNFTAQLIVGEPKIFIKERSIYVPRYLRGFYWEWTLTPGGFVYTGNF